MTRELFDAGDLRLRRVLRNLREGDAAPAEARARLQGALHLAGLSSPFASRPVPTVRPKGGRLPELASRAGSIWGLVAAGAVALVGGWLAWGPREPVGGALASHVLPAPVEEGRTKESDRQGDQTESPPSPRAAAPAARASEPAPEKRASRDSSLAAERRLLDAARAALVGGDSATGMDKLSRHTRQFPRGALAEEREALAVDALVASRRYDEARRRADAFRARYPGSLFAPSVAAALQAIP
jgi:hypothetical protein